MPKGIITRLIVRLNHLIDRENGEDLVWEKGVVLTNNGVRAQVQETITKQEGLKVIDIVLDGPSHASKEFLYEIRNEIKGIHRKSFKNINVKEMVPLPEQPDVAVPYSLLKQLDEMGEQKYAVQNSKGELVWVSVPKLLNGVELPPAEPEIEFEDEHDSDELRHGHRPRFSQRIEFKPQIHIETRAISHSEANPQFNFTIQLSSLQGSLNELRDEVAEVQPQLVEEIDEVAKRLEKLEASQSPEKVKNSGAMNKLRRFLEGVNDTSTALGKTVQNIKGGVKIAQDIAKHYNKIADWCGMPHVPKILLGK
jgi:hypothetical protein